MEFETLTWRKDGRIGRITLNRPDRYNAINETMAAEIPRAVHLANDDEDVHVVVLDGAGEGFCGGYDLKAFAEQEGPGSMTQEMPWDPTLDYKFMRACTDGYMSLFHSHKPTIAKIHGAAIAGGSDIALCCDIVVMAADGRIGYPPARVWGCPTTAMWTVRLGAEKAKRMLLTGDVVTGTEAAEMGLVLKAVPIAKLDEEVDGLARRMASVPQNQLMIQKLVVNQFVESQGLDFAQTLATIFDGIARHSPEGLWFKNYAERKGFKEAVAFRDSGRDIPSTRERRVDRSNAGDDDQAE